MTELGKYHGQRLKAKEVMQLYAAGERDFRGAILRGCNFRGVDLSGVDFSNADIRSTRFINAILRGTQFNSAKTGLQKRWLLGQFSLLALISASTGILHSTLFSATEKLLSHLTGIEES
ncbi:MAG: pentapeptide repeat-containing protein [Cyanobacteria bacterium P01_D01_bin.115]